MKITIFADIAGGISQKNYNADRITAASVCLPTESLDRIRKQIPPDLAKWRNASDSEVELMADLVLNEALGVAVYTVEKSGDKWEQFWDDAATVNSETRGQYSVVKAAFQIKCLMFVRTTAMVFASVIKANKFGGARRPPFNISTNETLIFDKEIDGEDNIEAFKSIWPRISEQEQLSELFGIRRNVNGMRFATEQDETLLLLPDYVAGIAHAGRSRANVLAASQVSTQIARSAQNRFEQASSYLISSEQFSLTHSDIFSDLF
jgi:hypothetical protein